MRIAFISDVHGNLAALEAVHADIQRQGVDQIVCLGDNVSGPLLPKETANYLMHSRWLVLAGNHDRQVLEFACKGGGLSDGYARGEMGDAEMTWMRGLRPSAWVSPEIYLCHGTPRSDCEHFLESIRAGSLCLATASEITDRLGDIDAALIVCGHSHVSRSIRTQANQLLLNPGSVGLQAYVDDEPERYVMELGTPDAHYCIAEKGSAGWRSAHFAVPYDNASMAQLAKAQGRLDWECALIRGYV